MRVTTLIAFDVISRHNYLKSEYNATIQCIFHESRGLLSQSLNYRWLAIPRYISSFYLTNLPPYRVNRVHLFSSPLLHEGCNNRSTVYLDFNLFNPHDCNNCSGALQKGSLEFGYWDHQLWILVCTANNSCMSLPLCNFSMDGKAIQDAEKRRFTAQWALLCRKILLLLNIIHIAQVELNHDSFSCIRKCEYGVCMHIHNISLHWHNTITIIMITDI